MKGPPPDGREGSPPSFLSEEFSTTARKGAPPPFYRGGEREAAKG